MQKNDFLEAYQKQALRPCQLKQLAILVEIDRICRKHHIDYWLESGTLLGAVRHSGFIPWDDDIDVGMMLPEVERFKQVAPNELPETMVLQTPETMPEAKEPIIKVRDLNSFFVEPGDRFNADYPKGLFVDIFPFVGYPTIPRNFCGQLVRTLCRSRAILHKPHPYGLRSVAEFFWFGAKYVACSFVWHAACLLTSRKKYASIIPMNNGYGTTHLRSSILPLSSVEFEGRIFSAPGDIDTFLRDLYGDYMQLPPPEKRKIHAIFMMEKLS